MISKNYNKKNIQFYIVQESAHITTPKKITVKKTPGGEYLNYDATLQSLNELNRNVREYKTSCIGPSLQAPHLLELRARHSWCGEAGHPMGTDKERLLTIDPTNISHRINTAEVTGDYVRSNIDTLLTPQGINMKNLIYQAMEVAFSLRAFVPMEVDQRGHQVASAPGRIVTYDWVILPSHEPSYMDPIGGFVNESVVHKSELKGYANSISVKESALINSLIKESYNVDLVSKSLELNGNFSLSSDMKTVIVTENSQRVYIPLENAITDIAKSYLKKFR